MLNHLSQLIKGEQNNLIHKLSDIEEVKRAVFGLNLVDSAGVPKSEVFTRKFCQYCWDIIATDVVTMIQIFLLCT